MPSNNTGLLDVAKNAASQTAEKASTWFDELRVKASEWLHNLDISVVKVVEIFSYVGVGFFVGFLLKKYFKSVLFVLAVFAGLIWVLQEFDLIVINWSHAQELANVAPNDTVGTLATSYIDWLRQNAVVALSVFAGFLIGYKVG